MRITVRLLAPLSILATALYLAFLARNRPDNVGLSITAGTSQNAQTGFLGGKHQDDFAIERIRDKKMGAIAATNSLIHP